jgi:hypothetical protein
MLDMLNATFMQFPAIFASKKAKSDWKPLRKAKKKRK